MSMMDGGSLEFAVYFKLLKINKETIDVEMVVKPFNGDPDEVSMIELRVNETITGTQLLTIGGMT